ncbi:uncharacterized protein BT62DRAFT_991169 [Guyanagaster necrorhizus]|uniref:Uncharacterized protein n=1 Tax=Guyanagaster necrorhizus TaxID=856835 RepID=A0A9P7W1N4_9AGAR|nr:uncharacterized protein BT62DRAFT_991169 [Guyanagaster necrorhizus MCA 3950]KAG7451681.1 hypothetical protein BT62DRAFT_991169 [Guyanagaster necrorhizus MCA 3950]
MSDFSSAGVISFADEEVTNAAWGDGLPQELVDAIADELEGQDDALRNASLVNQSFHSSCQKLLFSRIELKFRRPRPNPYIQFHRLILDSPRIAALVKTLRIHDFYGGGLESTWFLQDDILIPRIIELLVNLTSITVVAARFITRRSQNLSSAIRASLFYTPLPRLTSISLVNVILPHFQELVDLLVDRPALKEVKLLDVLVHAQTIAHSLPYHAVIDSSRLPQLSSLAVRMSQLNGTPFEMLMNSSFSTHVFGHLERLQFYLTCTPRSVHSGSLQKLLDMSRNTLKELVLYTFIERSTENFVDISCVPRITCVFSTYDFIGGLPDLFRGHYNHDLRRMEDVTLRVVSLDSQALNRCPVEIWESLDDLMVRVKNRVNFVVVTEPESVGRRGNKHLDKQKVKEGLRRTNLMGILDVEVIGGDLRTELERGYSTL